MGLKLFLSGVCVFVLPGTSAQVVVALLVTLGALHVTVRHRPFVEPSDNAVAVAALWAEVVALFGALLMRIQKLHAELVSERRASEPTSRAARELTRTPRCRQRSTKPASPPCAPTCCSTGSSSTAPSRRS